MIWPFSLFAKKKGAQVGYRLVRVASSERGTFGVLLNGNEPLCVTCEDPWKANKNNVSCIPAKTYEVEKRISQKYGHHWIVNDVPNRSFILIHFGNNVNDTEGCILIGRSFGHWEGLPSVMQSQDTMTMLRNTLPDNFTLTIEEYL